MSDRAALVLRIRNLATSLVLVAAVASGTILVGPQDLETETIKIAAFNIQVFGKTKRNKPEVMEALVDVAQEFDVLVIQEVRDASKTTAKIYLEALNDDPANKTFKMYEGPRVGRSSSKEQYVIYYAPALVELQHAFTYPDDDDIFEREPIVATFKAGEFDFTVVVCHVKPKKGLTESELVGLESVATILLEAHPNEEDIILMGDFNADGSYLNVSRLPEIFPPESYHSLIQDGTDTMTTSTYTYDRMFIMDATFDHEYVQGSAGVYRFDEELGLLNQEFTESVSDHYPIFAEFAVRFADDD